MGRLFVNCAVLAALLALALPARADALSPQELATLKHGGTVVRPQVLTRGERHYVGGVTYAIIDAPADDLASLLTRTESWRRILPRTREARQVGTAGGDALVEMIHGTALVQATYTMRVHCEGREVRFWMDPYRNHDMEDAWGFFRAEPLPDGRALVTYGVLIDMGPGLLRDMFEGRVQALALSVPDRVRTLVLERSATGTRASR